MKTKKQTKEISKLRKIKEAIKLIAVITIPVALSLYVLVQGGTFNAF